MRSKKKIEDENTIEVGCIACCNKNHLGYVLDVDDAFLTIKIISSKSLEPNTIIEVTKKDCVLSMKKKEVKILKKNIERDLKNENFQISNELQKKYKKKKLETLKNILGFFYGESLPKSNKPQVIFTLENLKKNYKHLFIE